MKFLAVRTALADVVQYRFFSENKTLFCSATIPVQTSSLVNIHQEQSCLRSTFNSDFTIQPGLMREVSETETGNVVFSLLHDTYSTYEIACPGRILNVFFDDRRGVIFTNEKREEVAMLYRLCGDTSFVAARGSASEQLAFLVECDDRLSEHERISILSFPLLRFDLQEIAAALVAAKNGTDPRETGIIIRPYIHFFYREDILSEFLPDGTE